MTPAERRQLQRVLTRIHTRDRLMSARPRSFDADAHSDWSTLLVYEDSAAHRIRAAQHTAALRASRNR